MDKGIKNAYLCIAAIIGTQGCTLVEDPARAEGERIATPCALNCKWII